jgi:hypothetical protein
METGAQPATAEMTQDRFNERHVELMGAMALAKEERRAFDIENFRDELRDLHGRFPLMSIHRAKAIAQVPEQY